MVTFVCVPCKRGLWTRVEFHGTAVTKLGPGAEAIVFLKEAAAPTCQSCGEPMEARGALAQVARFR